MAVASGKACMEELRGHTYGIDVDARLEILAVEDGRRRVGGGYNDISSTHGNVLVLGILVHYVPHDIRVLLTQSGLAMPL